MAFAAWPFLDERWRYNDDLLRGLSNYFGARPTARSAGVFPPLNFYDDGTTLMVRAEIPGANRETLEVTSQADQLDPILLQLLDQLPVVDFAIEPFGWQADRVQFPLPGGLQSARLRAIGDDDADLGVELA